LDLAVATQVRVHRLLTLMRALLNDVRDDQDLIESFATYTEEIVALADGTVKSLAAQDTRIQQ
jgi:hypothetical protein